MTTFIGEDVRGLHIEEAMKSKDDSKLTLEEQVYYQNALKFEQTGDSVQSVHEFDRG